MNKEKVVARRKGTPVLAERVNKIKCTLKFVDDGKGTISNGLLTFCIFLDIKKIFKVFQMKT